MDSFEINEAEANDIPFIYDTWLKSYRYESRLGQSCRNTIFFEGQKKVIDKILSSDSSTVLVARSKENKSVLLGYMVSEPGILHYAYVKSALVSLDIATALFIKSFGEKNAKVDYTHRTLVGAKIAADKPNLTHNPFHLYKTGE